MERTGGGGTTSSSGSLACNWSTRPIARACARCSRAGKAARNLELGDHLHQALDVLGARQTVIPVLDQSEDHVVLAQARRQFDRVVPWHIGVLHALQDAHRAAGFDQAAEQQMLASLL